ncbi:hypothetical protein Mic7113_5057 [Allocoleopsis franciscana PCC 7113]|uniref:Uncharacterized protein n=1 Tax=Allocoleopsis franciscana PCC 7113 TaxID=1173027 RepID=K9WLQ9_9CYAN|nr:hypothetical protein Mic7113_5057 [Allocoleopsis franciscana PCC 7113]
MQFQCTLADQTQFQIPGNSVGARYAMPLQIDGHAIALLRRPPRLADHNILQAIQVNPSLLRHCLQT